MKIFGFKYKTRKELIEEIEKLKAEKKAEIGKLQYICQSKKYQVHKCYAKFIVPFGDESYLSVQRIKEHLYKQLGQELLEDIIFKEEIDLSGRIMYSVEIPVLRKEEKKYNKENMQNV